MMEPIAKVINLQGQEIGEIAEGDKIVRKKSVDYLSMTIQINDEEQFTKVFNKNMFKLSRELSGPEMAFIYYMLQYIRYESGMLAHENGKPLEKSVICEEIGRKVRWVEQVLKELESKEVIFKHKQKYFVNPFLFMRGQRISKTLYEMFENSRWAK